MTILYAAGRLLATLSGAGIVLGLTQFLILSQSMDDAHALKAWVIAGGIIAGGLCSALMHGSARRVLITGIICAELFNIGQVAEQNWRERATRRAELAQSNVEAMAAYTAALDAHTAAEARLTKAEAAKATADAVVANANKTKDCKAKCMEGNLSQARDAAADVTAARTALQQHPKPAAEPVTLDPDAGAASWQWDLAMGIIGSIGGNLLAIALVSFGTHGATAPSGRRAERVSEGARKELPEIIVADVSAADAAVLVAANERALAGMRSSIAAAQSRTFGEIKAAALATAERSPLTGPFGGPLPDRSGAEVVQLFPDPNGSPNGSGGPKGGRTVRRKTDVLADIQARIVRGERFESQEELRQALAGRFGTIAKSTLSEWLGELEATISRHTEGRRKVVG